MESDNTENNHVLSVLKNLLQDGEHGKDVKISELVAKMQSEGVTADTAVAVIQELIFDRIIELTKHYCLRLPSIST